MTSNLTLSIEFSGASAKRMPYRGWVGKITDWPEKKPPTMCFGTWKPSGNDYGGGVAEIVGIRPYEVFMYGANSPKMRPKDKFTRFGYAGLTDDGKLRCIPIRPDQGDARALWQTDGLLPRGQILKDAESALSQLSADGTVDSLLGMYQSVGCVFKEWSLPFLGTARDGNHLDLLARLTERLPTIAHSIADLGPFLGNVSQFIDQWRTARDMRRRDRKDVA